MCFLSTERISLLGFDDNAQQVRAFIPPVKSQSFLQTHTDYLERGSDALLRALALPSERAGTDSEWPPVFRRQKPLTSTSSVCSASADFQAAHVINPVRRNPGRKNLVVSLLFRFAFNV